MNSIVKETPVNGMTWFDMGQIGIYITPELICGRPCILLLDVSSVFLTNEVLKGQLQKNDFQVVRFEFNADLKEHLYILFTDKIDSSFFYKDLCIPMNAISSYSAPLVDIQSVFYEHAKQVYGFRIDVLVKSSTYLGLNHLNNEVYTSNFGRFKISQSEFNGTERVYSTEKPHEKNIAYLRADSLEDVFFCSEGFVLDSIATRRNVTLADVIRFAATLYQEENKSIDISKVKLYQILMVQNVFNAIYTANILPLGDAALNHNDFFDLKEHYKTICLNSEACPSPPRAIYTDYLASQYSTPAPLSYIMQKLLVHGDADVDNTILDPMLGYGSLINVLHKKNYSITGLEKSPKKYKLAMELKYSNAHIECCDSLNSKITDYMPKGEKFQYIICNPACLVNDKKYEYSDNLGSIVVERTDFIALLKTLSIRKQDGRSVFLLPYFISSDVVFAVDQIKQIEDVLNFVHARYEIEGFTAISSEIYSKSLAKISPFLIVVGKKREKIESSEVRFVKEALDSTINDYESLWDWANLLCYKRSDAYQKDVILFQKTQELVAAPEFFEGDIDSDNQEAVESDELDFSTSEVPFIPKSNGLNLSSSDYLFESLHANTETPLDERVDSGVESAQDVATDGVEPTPDVQTETPSEEEVETTSGTHATSDTPNTPDTPDTSNTSIEDEVKVEDKTSNESSFDDPPENSRPLAKGKANNKITKSLGNFFGIEQQNKIIRYHSLATLSDPSSNVHLSTFRSYLLAKKNLNQAIVDSYDALSLNNTEAHKASYMSKLKNYNEKHDVEVNIESFIGGHLELGEPKSFVPFFKSEHLDFIAASIIKFIEKKSIFIADSLGMGTETSLAALIHFYRLNDKGVIYIAKDEDSINALISTYEYLNHHVFKGGEVEFIVAHKYNNVEKVVSSFGRKKVLILLNDPKFLPKLKVKDLVNVLNNIDAQTCIFDTDLSSTKYSVGFITQALRSPTIFRSNKWISQDTNLGLLSGLFTKNVSDRYFPAHAGGFDNMSSHLLKLNLIENYAYFERFEDLSNIKLNVRSQNLWGGKYGVLTQSYSRTINNIAILAEEIHRGILEKKESHQKLAMMRSVAMRIFDLCEFCISTIPLTHSIFEAIKKHSKPIVVIPENIEDILFALLENLQVELLGEYDRFKIHNLAQLNQLIAVKMRDFQDNTNIIDEQKNYPLLNQMESDLNELIYIRTLTVNTYLTNSKTGTVSKYPDITSLIAAFYQNCILDMDESLTNYSEVSAIAKKIEAEIEVLADLPLCVADFLSYELSRYNIKCAELSTRSFSIFYEAEKTSWMPKDVSPVAQKEYSEAIVDNFNNGEIDLLIVEASELSSFDLSSTNRDLNEFSDYMRKRILFLTYFNQPVSHYLKLIHAVNSSEQFVSPEIHLEVAENPIQKSMAQLLVQQLGIFNIFGIQDKLKKPDLTYYFTDSGQSLLAEYLTLNPSYQAHHPTLPLKKWSLFNVLNIANMTEDHIQEEIIEHLAYFAKQHLEYLRDTKKNPFDLFTVAPKAKFSEQKVDSEALYLNKNLASSDTSFNSKMQLVTLEYVKNTSDCFTLADCKGLYTGQKELEIGRLKSLISKYNELSGIHKKFDDLKHSELLTLYINSYTDYLINIYRDKVFNVLYDRYGNWIFKERICSLKYLKTYFLGKNGLRVSDTLERLYSEICMLGDADLILGFEKACEIASFLKAYQLAVLKQEASGHEQPILIPVASPFNDDARPVQEGLLMKVNFPASIMLSLSPKSFTLSLAYPNKSKITDLSLAYVLERPEVLRGQNILSKLSKSKIDAILKTYHKSKYKDLLGKKLNECNFTKVTAFTGLPYLSSVEQHATIREFSKPILPNKIRRMDVLTGNLFEVYHMLHKKYPLTMVDFVNNKGLTQYGFAIPSDVNIGDVMTCLIRTTSIHNTEAVYDYFAKNHEGFKSIRSIQWYGDSGISEAIHLNDELVELSFTGSEQQLQLILLDEDVFEEYPVINVSYDSEGNIIEQPVSVRKNKFKFKPLNLLDAVTLQVGRELTFKFKLQHQQLKEFISLVSKKNLYGGVLVDCNLKHERLALSKIINK